MIKIKVGEKCVGCGICVKICPTDVLEVVEKRSTPAKLEECMACRVCEAACPMNTIKIIEPEWQ